MTALTEAELQKTEALSFIRGWWYGNNRENLEVLRGRGRSGYKKGKTVKELLSS